jgi:hypothetical protein
MSSPWSFAFVSAKMYSHSAAGYELKPTIPALSDVYHCRLSQNSLPKLKLFG